MESACNVHVGAADSNTFTDEDETEEQATVNPPEDPEGIVLIIHFLLACANADTADFNPKPAVYDEEETEKQATVHPPEDPEGLAIIIDCFICFILFLDSHSIVIETYSIYFRRRRGQQAG